MPALAFFLFNFKLYQMKTQKQFVDKVYKLTKEAAPLSYMLPTRNTKRFPLLWFDENAGYNRALRYAKNQKTPFEDEQDGNAILEPVIFENGFLRVRCEDCHHERSGRRPAGPRPQQPGILHQPGAQPVAVQPARP